LKELVIETGLDPSGITYYYQMYDSTGKEWVYGDGFEYVEEIEEELTELYKILQNNYSFIDSTIKVVRNEPGED